MPGQPKVRQLGNFLFANKDVLWLDVAVDEGALHIVVQVTKSPRGIEGKALASAWPAIDDLARSLGVTPFAELGDDDEADDERPASEMPWFDAADGLRTVQAILGALDSDPSALPDSEYVRYDLEDVRDVLTAASENRVRFRFAMLS